MTDTRPAPANIDIWCGVIGCYRPAAWIVGEAPRCGVHRAPETEDEFRDREVAERHAAYHGGDLEERIRSADEAADEAYWAVIAERFPEVTSGDVDPSWVQARRETNAEFIRVWRSDNMAEEEAR